MSVEHSITRSEYLAEQIVIVDGQPGCGKTLFSPIVAALDRVELLTYAYEMEYICSLRYLDKIAPDAAMSMVRMLTDLQLYNTMMGREVNFRPTDLSSIFMDANPWRYLRRIFMKGDETIPKRISKEKPVLHLTTHNLLAIGEPVFQALGNRLVFIEIVRHPLYMIKQQDLNMQKLIGNPRDFIIYFRHGQQDVPFWVKGEEDRFIQSNTMEKAIHMIQCFSEISDRVRDEFKEKYHASMITIPFESFVLNPWPYMEQMTQALNSKMTPLTMKMLKKQNVPRKRIADGIALPIYKRCGWVPSQAEDESKELEIRWNWAVERASKETLNVLAGLCVDYEQRFMEGKKEYLKKGL